MAFQYPIRIPKATWAAGAAQNASIDANVALAAFAAGINGNGRNAVKGISIVSQDNGAWELWAFATATRFPVDLDANKFLAKWAFATGDATTTSSDATSSYYYYIDGNDIQIRDDDNTGKIHLSLIRRDAALVAGHSVVIELKVAPESQFPGL